MNRNWQDVIEYLKEENCVLCEQIGEHRLSFTDDQRRRLVVEAKALGSKVLGDLGCSVTPDTVLRWYRRLVVTKYDGSRRRGPGRPRTASQTADLVVRIAVENPRLAYTRIRDALGNLGHEVGRNAVKRLLAEDWIEPAPERGQRTPWKTFLGAHWDALATADFFTVEAVSLRGLVRYSVFFVIELQARRVEIPGISCQPCGEWMKQVACHGRSRAGARGCSRWRGARRLDPVGRADEAGPCRGRAQVSPLRRPDAWDRGGHEPGRHPSDPGAPRPAGAPRRSCPARLDGPPSRLRSPP